MVRSVLVVCVGNICRSVAAERMLQARLPKMIVSSAGLAAVLGAPADPVTAEVAAARGLVLEGHVARQLTAGVGSAHELILAVTPDVRSEIMRRFPQLSGRTMALDHWTGGRGVTDPHGAPREVHAQVLDSIAEAVDAWVARLGAAG